MIGGGILGLLIIVFDIYAMLQVLGSGIDPIKKLLWILLIWVLPVLGLLVWYVAGPKRSAVSGL